MSKKGKYYHRLGPGIILLFSVQFIFSFSDAESQISYGGRPHKFDGNTLNEIPVIRMPAFDIQSYAALQRANKLPGVKPLVFARPFEVEITPEKDGIWKEQGGTAIWRVVLQSRGAFSLNIIFSKFRLEPGVRIFVYNPSRTQILGSFDHRNNRPSAALALSPVRGDKMIVEMHVDHEAGHWGDLVIGRVNHDFINILDTKSNRIGRSEECNIDINCPPGNHWQRHKHGIVRLTINGTTFCTGVLVNNTSNDGKPYLLTANHCVADNDDATGSVFLFGFESSFCNGNNGNVNMTLSGAELLATQENLDFSLLELNEIPPRSYRPWYAGWNRTGQIPQSTVTIHHPQGDVKKIAIDLDPPETGTFGPGYTPEGHWRILQFDYGTTESGSSGSPLFDQNGHLKGLLTGGSARCGSAVNDFFCKFSLAWSNYPGDSHQLQPWLDAAGTGRVTMEGFNPYREDMLEADFTFSTREICAGDMVVFTDFSSGDIESWSWDFGNGANPPFASSPGPHLVEYTGNGVRTVSLRVENAEGMDMAEKEIDLVISPVELVAGFSYIEEGLTVQFIDQSDFAVNYYWEFGDGEISTLNDPANTYSNEGEYTVSQLVRNRACSDTASQEIFVTVTSAESVHPSRELMVYPVPAVNFIIVETGTPFASGALIELLSSEGRQLVRQNLPAGQSQLKIDTGRYPSGMYILKIATDNEQFNLKIPVIK